MDETVRGLLEGFFGEDSEAVDITFRAVYSGHAGVIVFLANAIKAVPPIEPLSIKALMQAYAGKDEELHLLYIRNNSDPHQTVKSFLGNQDLDT